MKIYEIIEEGTIHKITFQGAKDILSGMGFGFKRQAKGSHEIWGNDHTHEVFLLTKDGKDASAISSDKLKKLMKKYNYIHTFEEDII